MLYSAGLDVRLRQCGPRTRDVIGWLFSDDVTCPRAAILRRVLHPGNCDVLSRRSYRDDLSPRVFLANFPPVETELSATTFRASRSMAWTCSPSTTTRSLRTATTATPCRKPKLRHKGSHHKKTVKLGEKSKPLTNCVAWICENQNANSPRRQTWGTAT